MVPPVNTKVTLMDRGRIGRSIRRIAYQIAEKAKERKVALVGMNERGYAVAKQLKEEVQRACDNEIVLISYDVVNTPGQAETIRKEHDFEHSMVVLVDDVIFTGRTMFTALSNLLHHPDFTVFTAVLVDRGHRSLPVASEFVGMEIPTKPNEHVEMTLRDGSAEEIFLYREE